MNGAEPLQDITDILAALAGERWPVDRARSHISPVPGLYAIYGDTSAWAELGIDPRPASALYIGKSEDNLVRRELETHFAADANKKPQTGSSTVRRSFAALLRETLQLQAVPRHPEKPGYFSNYGLTSDGDSRLTAWMHKHLTIAVWERPNRFAQSLSDVEGAVIRHWRPSLNITHNPEPLARLRTARAAMALEASRSTINKMPESAELVDEVPLFESSKRAVGLTPLELARRLGKDPKWVRQKLRDKYGKLPVTGDRWGALTQEQEAYIRTLCR